jgi:hypothetical protein
MGRKQLQDDAPISKEIISKAIKQFADNVPLTRRLPLELDGVSNKELAKGGIVLCVFSFLMNRPSTNKEIQNVSL